MRQSSVPEQFFQPETLDELHQLNYQAHSILHAAFAHTSDLDARTVLVDLQWKAIETMVSVHRACCLELKDPAGIT